MSHQGSTYKTVSDEVKQLASQVENISLSGKALEGGKRRRKRAGSKKSSRKVSRKPSRKVSRKSSRKVSRKTSKPRKTKRSKKSNTQQLQFAESLINLGLQMKNSSGSALTGAGKKKAHRAKKIVM